jgi:hypothetical protein
MRGTMARWRWSCYTNRYRTAAPAAALDWTGYSVVACDCAEPCPSGLIHHRENTTCATTKRAPAGQLVLPRNVGFYSAPLLCRHMKLSPFFIRFRFTGPAPAPAYASRGKRFVAVRKARGALSARVFGSIDGRTAGAHHS